MHGAWILLLLALQLGGQTLHAYPQTQAKGSRWPGTGDQRPDSSLGRPLSPSPPSAPFSNNDPPGLGSPDELPPFSGGGHQFGGSPHGGQFGGPQGGAHFGGSPHGGRPGLSPGGPPFSPHTPGFPTQEFGFPHTGAQRHDQQCRWGYYNRHGLSRLEVALITVTVLLAVLALALIGALVWSLCYRQQGKFDTKVITSEPGRPAGHQGMKNNDAYVSSTAVQPHAKK